MILILSKTNPIRSFGPGNVVPKLQSFVKDLVGYSLCSAAALTLDCGLLFGLTKAGMSYLPAAAIGFFSGMLLAYVLSIHFVYAGRRRPDHKTEAAGFFAIGFAGLLLNQILLFGLIDGMNLSLESSKVCTAACVFAFNFAARRSMLFSSGSPSN